jgi:probable addiction module antidote protein
MEKIKTRPFDAAEFLDTEEAQAEFLTAALEENDAEFFAYALGVVARARGMTLVAKESGLGRQSLYKALDDGGNPTLDTVLRVLDALGIRLVATPAHHAAE